MRTDHPPLSNAELLFNKRPRLAFYNVLYCSLFDVKTPAYPVRQISIFERGFCPYLSDLSDIARR